MSESGRLITFEGVDLSGKSLQARLLFERMRDQGMAVKLLREPGSTAISEKIRSILLDVENEELVKEAELLLYSAARTQMVSQEIIPSLKAGNLVICDRYYDSTTAYQGDGREIDLEFVAQLNTFVTHHIKPDLTFLIDIDPVVAIRRQRAQENGLDRLEKEAASFHRKVREAYLEIARSESGRSRFIIIDGDAGVEEIQNQIHTYVKDRLNI